jgi:hypothetical protein
MTPPETYRAGSAVRMYVMTPDPCLCAHVAHPDQKCAVLGCGCTRYRTTEPPNAA